MSEQQPTPNETVDEVVAEALRGEVKRRDFLRRVVRLGVSSAVAYKLLDETTAQAQAPDGWRPKMTTYALGEEGNPAKSGVPSNGVNRSATTLAVGEEGARPTTYAVGEENSRPPTTNAIGEEQPDCIKPQPTTKAVGEEGKPPTRPTTMRVGEESKVTTGAHGEESGSRPTPTTLAVGEEGKPIRPPKPNPTTMAIGEEGQSRPFTKPTPSKLIQRIPTRWKNFRRW